MHSWNLTPTEAIKLQKELRARIALTPLARPIRTIAGADVSFNKYDEDVYAGIVVLSYPELIPLTHALAKIRVTFPYIPGLLSFREIPALMEAWDKLPEKPDLTIVDGHGIAHPRRMGIATHFGLATDSATIGCAKSVLTGTYTEPALTVGSHTPLLDPKTNEPLGIALRSSLRAKPIFISPGHRITHEEAYEVATQCLRGYKLPEPTRHAHLLTNKFRRGELFA